MANTLSSTATASVNASTTGEVWVILLTITHPSITTLRYAQNDEDVTSRSNTYTAKSFRGGLPDESQDQLPQVSVVIEDMDQELIAALRSIQPTTSARPQCQIEMVLADSPDTVELGPFTFDIQQFNYEAQSITLMLGLDNILKMPFPGGRMIPSNYPGLF